MEPSNYSMLDSQKAQSEAVWERGDTVWGEKGPKTVGELRNVERRSGKPENAEKRFSVSDWVRLLGPSPPEPCTLIAKPSSLGFSGKPPS